jgi:hypothetical protein
VLLDDAGCFQTAIDTQLLTETRNCRPCVESIDLSTGRAGVVGPDKSGLKWRKLPVYSFPTAAFAVYRFYDVNQRIAFDRQSPAALK